jgi:outer membrane protein insertion porin family
VAGNACYLNGEASMAVRKELAEGAVWASTLGYSLVYSTLDSNKTPTSGIYAELKQDFAGIGGDIKFIRTTVDTRSYYEIFADVIGLLRVQAGHIAGWSTDGLRMLDHFQMGPNLVRGFATSGLGPRDLTSTNQDALGGSMYWAASAEVQTPFKWVPKDVGIKGAIFADVGSLWGYKGPTFWSVTGESISPSDSASIRAAVGVGVIWNSPFGPLRFDYAVPVLKQNYDRVQEFRFGGGTKF